ncbi:MAG: nucleotidyltransferase domain-containing protein [bacterium]|nr:nucleotidyltransferase domain-containing protein [bacterium]
MKRNAESLIEAIAAATPDCLLVYLFGSAGTLYERPNSDLDIAVLCNERLNMKERSALGLKIEQTTGRTVDLIDLATADPIIRRQVIANGTLVHAHERATRSLFEMKTLSEYLDLKIDRRASEQRLVETSV